MANPVILPISTYITYAKIIQYTKEANDAVQKIFDGGTVVSDYSVRLRQTRLSVEFAYGRNPNDETLNETGAYLYSLINNIEAASVVANAGCVPPVIITNPSNQTVNSGSNVSFSVGASGTSLTYQWYKNGVLIGGATNPTYSITGAVSGDAGTFYAIVSNGCGSAQSTSATLTINSVALTGSYYFGDTDFFTALNGGTDAVPYVGTFPITNGNPLVVNFTAGAANNKCQVVRYPNSQSDKTHFVNTVLNSGDFPPPSGGPEYHQVIVIGNFKYIVSRGAISLDISTQIVTYS